MIDGAVQVDVLSEHFMRRWIQRRGAVPSVESVNLILRKGQVLKRGQDLYKSVRGRLYQFRTLTEVWVHAEALIIWVDEPRGKAVTVIVPEAHLSEDGASSEGSAVSTTTGLSPEPRGVGRSER